MDKKLGLSLTGPEKLGRTVSREVTSGLGWHREEARRGYQTSWGKVPRALTVVAVRISTTLNFRNVNKNHRDDLDTQVLATECQGVKNSKF